MIYLWLTDGEIFLLDELPPVAVGAVFCLSQREDPDPSAAILDIARLPEERSRTSL